MNAFAKSYIAFLNLYPRYELEEIEYIDIKPVIRKEYRKMAQLQNYQRVRDFFPFKPFVPLYKEFKDLYSAFHQFQTDTQFDHKCYKKIIPIEFIAKISLIRKTAIVSFVDIFDHVFFTYAPGQIKVSGMTSKKSRRLLITRLHMMRMLQLFFLRSKIYEFNLHIFGFSSDFKKLMTSLLNLSPKKIKAYTKRFPQLPNLRTKPFRVPFFICSRPEMHHQMRIKKKRRIKRKIVKKLLRKNRPAV